MTSLLLLLCIAQHPHLASGAVKTVRIAFYNGGGAFSGDNKQTHAHEHEFYSAIATAGQILRGQNLTARGIELTNVTEANITAGLKVIRGVLVYV